MFIYNYHNTYSSKVTLFDQWIPDYRGQKLEGSKNGSGWKKHSFALYIWYIDEFYYIQVEVPSAPFLLIGIKINMKLLLLLRNSILIEMTVLLATVL